MIVGWYYLHTNGELIFKHGAEAAMDIRDSTFARGLWPMDPNKREGAWTIVVEGLAAGASRTRAAELASKWELTDEDGAVFAERIGVSLMVVDGTWLATAGAHTGHGARVYEALAHLAQSLGYRPAKMWGRSLRDLVKQQAAAA